MAGSGNSVNVYPRGFLAALDAKTNGQTPQSFEEKLRTIFDLTQFYLSSNKETEQGQTTAFVAPGYHAAGAIPLLGPPQDEVWYLHQLDASTTAAIGAGATIVGHTAADWGSGTTPLKLGDSATFTAGNIAHWGGAGGSATKGIFILPGWTLGFMATSVIVGGEILTVTAWVTKLKI